jgi:transcriptional regulator NrdR family protein
MDCPHCERSDHGVRHTEQGGDNNILRIRRCKACKQPFPTSENVIKVRKIKSGKK